MRATPAAVARERPVRPDHAVAGHDDADRVAAVGEPHGPGGRRRPERGGELAVGRGLAVGDVAQRRPDALLERRAAQGEREVERRELAREVGRELLAHRRQPVVGARPERRRARDRGGGRSCRGRTARRPRRAGSAARAGCRRRCARCPSRPSVPRSPRIRSAGTTGGSQACSWSACSTPSICSVLCSSPKRSRRTIVARSSTPCSPQSAVAQPSSEITRCAETAGLRSLIAQTCRSWTSATPSTSSSAVWTSSTSMPAGRALEQDVPGLAQEGHGAGQEDRDDHQRGERVGVGPPGGHRDHGGGEHGHRAQRVAEHVQRGAADVHPAAAALQDRERDDVADETDEAVDQQRAAGHLGGAGEALDRLDRDPHRDPEQQHRVQRGAQHLGAAEPEGPAPARRAGGERGGGEGGAEGDDVGADVPEVGEQRQRPREDRADGADDEHQRGDAERERRAAAGRRHRRRVRDHVRAPRRRPYMHTYAYGRGGAVRHTSGQRRAPTALECAGARQSLARRHRWHGRTGLRRAVRRARARGPGPARGGPARRRPAPREARPAGRRPRRRLRHRACRDPARPARPPRGRRRPRRLDARRGPRRSRPSSTGAWSTSANPERCTSTTPSTPSSPPATCGRC